MAISSAKALNATFSGSGRNAGVVSGSLADVTAAPYVGPLPGGSRMRTHYLSIGAGGTETITFASEENSFGLYGVRSILVIQSISTTEQPSSLIILALR